MAYGNSWMGNGYPYYGYPQSPIQPNASACTVSKVHGEEGAKQIQIGPNSSMIVIDEDAPLIWLIQTDALGTKTLSPYTITPYKQVTVEDTLQQLSQRLEKIEEQLHEQSNFRSNAGQQNPANNRKPNTK